MFGSSLTINILAQIFYSQLELFLAQNMLLVTRQLVGKCPFSARIVRGFMDACIIRHNHISCHEVQLFKALLQKSLAVSLGHNFIYGWLSALSQRWVTTLNQVEKCLNQAKVNIDKKSSQERMTHQFFFKVTNVSILVIDKIGNFKFSDHVDKTWVQNIF